MRRKAFVVFILGMFILMLSFSFDGTMDGEVGSRVSVSGTVVSEKVFGEERLLVLDSGINIICECSGKWKGEKILVEGIIEEYNELKRVRALTISN